MSWFGNNGFIKRQYYVIEISNNNSNRKVEIMRSVLYNTHEEAEKKLMELESKENNGKLEIKEYICRT